MVILKGGWNKARIMEKIRAGNNGNKSIGPDGRCHYRSPNGNKCAIGCFIPDEKYDPAMDDGMMTRQVCEIIRDDLPTNDINFLYHLQSAHDTCRGDNVYEMIEKFLDNEGVE